MNPWRAVPAALLAVGLVPGAQAQRVPTIAPGVSLELARTRAAALSDVRYDVDLRIPAHRDSAVTGTVTIGLTRAGGGPLVVDFADPSRIRSVTVDGQAAESHPMATHVVIMDVPAGRRQVTLEFVAGDGPLNRRDEFLYTLFVPARAHEAIPCFDQPDVKARFRLTLSVPAGWRAVANGAAVDTQAVSDRVAYRFAETEPIPTYLFAFAAGRFQVVERERAGRTMRLFHRETDSTRIARNVDATFDLHETALRWLEDYTGIAYPFDTFDFVAVPSFQYRGMEHPGAILYRASRLFLDESATRDQELARASVIAHETAHMWFGDLVTMEWFDDVWMKEVFANFLAAKIVNPSFAELNHELRFLLAHYPPAYSVDRTPGANPIRQPLENLAEAGSLYGAIIYQKAPIVMRQLERLVGEAAFRQAVRRYLDGHRFGNAGWPALVAELDRVTELDVAEWSEVWIETPGRPWVHVERPAEPDGNGVTLRPDDPRGRGMHWPQLLEVGLIRSDSAEVRRVRFDSSTVRLELEAGVDGVLPNAGGLGYGLFVLDPETAAMLTQRLPALRPAVSRAAGWLDLWELMLEGRVDPEVLLELARLAVAVEADELIIQQLLGDLTDLFWRYVDPDVRQSAAADVEGLLWAEMLEAPSTSLKAAFLEAWRAVATTSVAVDRMADLWRGELEIPGLTLSERDRTALALELAVREATGWRSILAAQETRIENPDRQARFRFIRPAVSADSAVRDSFFASLAVADNRAREEWVVAALRHLHHPLRAASSRRYLRASLELLEEVRATGDIFFPSDWLAASFSGHASPEAAAIVRRFIDERASELPPRLLEKLLQEADPVFRAVAIRGDG